MADSICTVPDCDRAQNARGMCPTHYARWRRHGDPEAPLQRQPNVGMCSVEGCEQPSRKRTWCASHYSQWTRLGEVRPFGYKWAAQDGTCVVCGDPVPRESGRRKHCSQGCQVADSRTKGQRPKSFVCDYCGNECSTGRRADGRLQRVDTRWCPDCGRTSPEVQRFRRYKVTRDQYAAALRAGCSICGDIVAVLHVDHDHACCPANKYSCGRCVRGFICGPCNRGIGLFFDNPNALQRAADYLNQWRLRPQ